MKQDKTSQNKSESVKMSQNESEKISTSQRQSIRMKSVEKLLKNVLQSNCFNS